jgi:hypothetical protein
MKRKQLSKEERRGEQAFAAHERIRAFYALIRQTNIEIFKELQNVYTNQWYKDILGDEQGTWRAYLNLKEINSTKAEVDKAFRVMTRLVGQFEMDPVKLLDVQITRLDDIVRFAKDKDDAQQLLNKAEALDANDWQTERNQLLGRPVFDDGHQHEDEDFHICKLCHRKKKVN